MIACVRLPYFDAQVARHAHPALADKAFVLHEPDFHPNKVSAISPEAGKAGIRRWMTLAEALALCPDLHIEATTRLRHHRALDRLLALLADFSPKVQAEDIQPPRKARGRRTATPIMPSLSDDPAVVYLDLGRTRSKDAQTLAWSMHQAVMLGLQVRPAIGLASGRFPAWVGALSLNPGMAAVIPHKLEADFLADYPVELLPVDGETLRQFHLLGLRRLGQVAALPAPAMLDRFGKPGQTLHRLAQGIDRRAVLPYTPQIVERVVHTFDVPVVDQRIVERVLAELVGALAGKLSKQGRLARDLDLQITLDNQRILEEAIILRQPTANAGHISRSAGLLLDRMAVNRPVTDLQITLTGITPVGARQLSLFEREPLQREELQAVLRDLSAKFGADCFYRVELADPAARLPEQRYHFRQAVDE